MQNSKSPGRKEHQLMNAYLVYHYLLRNSDASTFVKADKIAAYLREELGIPSERRSVYRDIKAINDSLWLIDNAEYCDLEFGCDDALEEVKEDGSYYETIKYKKKHAFYVEQRKYEAKDIKLIAECIYPSRFITQKQAESLVE